MKKQEEITLPCNFPSNPFRPKISPRSQREQITCCNYRRFALTVIPSTVQYLKPHTKNWAETADSMAITLCVIKFIFFGKVPGVCGIRTRCLRRGEPMNLTVELRGQSKRIWSPLPLVCSLFTDLRRSWCWCWPIVDWGVLCVFWCSLTPYCWQHYIYRV